MSFSSTAHFGVTANCVLSGPAPAAHAQMNHLPISDGSLDLLRQSRPRRKIYTHINNTNPILMPGTRERAQVEQAGIEIASDGLEIVCITSHLIELGLFH